MVAKSRITQMFAVCSKERMKNANTQHFQPFRRNVAYYVALLKQLFDVFYVFFCPYSLFGQVPKHKLNASTQPLSTNYYKWHSMSEYFLYSPSCKKIPQSASTTKFAEKADPNSCCNSTVFFRRWKSIPAKDLESIFIICHNLKVNREAEYSDNVYHIISFQHMYCPQVLVSLQKKRYIYLHLTFPRAPHISPLRCFGTRPAK